MTGKRKRKHKDAPPASVAVASLLGAKKVEKKKGRKVKKARKAGTAKCGKENAQVEDKDKNIDDCANKAKKRKHALDGMDAEQKRVKLGDAEGAGQIQRETLSRQVKGKAECLDSQAQAAAQTRGKDSSQAFVPSKSFQGARPGYAFKKGAQGLGYYLDMQAKAAGHRKGKDEKGKDESKGFIPAKSFQGVRPGFAFKKGAKGLGYYLDMQPHVQDKKLRLR
mmetsp:Transcript_70984/g.132785  ORF Transcript_70984/g.132785 Transcript_70984/m.132785 type:complete len:222 (-) Transcript_70984:99-764(-)